ncbi:hypothetical protein O181_033089 [Austropuccinia psidii MF-1]|uniref:Uncharacterized protein n=1 Tax=Austropuccinia psidii MF-1 TaxID=1389203 RepID=A0A9Q3H869_9BASI|nr:hypothetical protein [Austropuccinia psidii MF-1]
MEEPLQTEDSGNQANPRQTHNQDVLSSGGQRHNQSSTEEHMQTDDSGDHYNQRNTHHQNFRGSSGQRDNSESSAPQPVKHGSSSSCYPLHNLADAFVQDSHHHEQQKQQRRAQRASKQLSKKK